MRRRHRQDHQRWCLWFRSSFRNGSRIFRSRRRTPTR